MLEESNKGRWRHDVSTNRGKESYFFPPVSRWDESAAAGWQTLL
jgi:hypothetical protein